MKQCSQCQRSFEDALDFCPHDGTRLLALGEPAADPWIGVMLEGRYRLLGHLGSGAMGAVYRAEQVNVGREVAVKLLPGDGGSDPKLAKRFENEAKIVSRLRHPNALRLIDFGQTQRGQLYFVTELLHGMPLDKRLRQGPLDDLTTVRIVRQIADCLDEAHGLGVVHRDLKPANIFLERIGDREIVRVLDFGIAKVSHQPSTTSRGVVYGTPAYCSPEQAKEQPLDGRSDLYSLGVVAYVCRSGAPLFRADSAPALLLKHVREPPPSLLERVPDADPELAQLIHGLLAKDPQDRPASAQILRDRCEAIEARLAHREPNLAAPITQTLATAPPVTASTPTPAPGRKGPALAMILVLIFFVGALLAWPKEPQVVSIDAGVQVLDATPVLSFPDAEVIEVSVDAGILAPKRKKISRDAGTLQPPAGFIPVLSGEN